MKLENLKETKLERSFFQLVSKHNLTRPIKPLHDLSNLDNLIKLRLYNSLDLLFSIDQQLQISR